MLVILAVIAARMIDPFVLIACLLAGMASRKYWIAVIAGSIVAAIVFICFDVNLRNGTAWMTLMAAGAIDAVIGQLIWRKLPSDFKESITNPSKE